MRQKSSSVGQKIHGKPLERLKRLRTDDASTCVDLGTKRKTQAPTCDGLVLRSGKRLFNHDVHTVSSKGHSVNCESTDINGNAIAKGVVEARASEPTRKNDSDAKSPTERSQEHTSRMKGLRRKRDMASVKVFFSHHLDGDIIKQQKKVLAWLGASIASSISEATHFIANRFVQTRHMLEAIAFGKPVISHLWLDSCGQASCLIDEKNYILRDARKEKEFGFSLPVSLARASEQPLLKGIRVLIMPDTKPGKEILASLVKAVHGLVVERMGSRSLLKDEIIEDDLLILSCQEDYTLCAFA